MGTSEPKTTWQMDAGRVLQELDKLGTKMVELSTKVEQVGTKTEKAGKKHSESFGAKVIGDLRNYALGFIGVSQAIGFVISALKQMDAAQEAIAQKKIAAAYDVGKLAQLAGGDPAKMKELVEGTRKAAREGGGRDMAEAARLIFELESGERLKDLEFAARLAAIAGPEGPAPLLGAAGKFAKGYGPGAGETPEIMSLALAAAGPVPGTGMSEILQAGAKTGAIARQLGISAPELLAALSRVSQEIGPEEAGTAVNFLMRKLWTQGYGEKYGGRPDALAGMLEEIRAQNLSPQQLTAKLDARAMKAFLPLEPGALRERTEAGRAAVREGLVYKDIQLGEEAIGAVRERQKAEGRLDQTKSELADLRNRSTARLADQEAGIYNVLGEIGSEPYAMMGKALRYIPGLTTRFAEEETATITTTAKLFGGPIGATFAAMLRATEKLESALRRRPVTQAD